MTVYGHFTHQACPAFLNPSNDTFPKDVPQQPNGLCRVSRRQQAGRFKQIGMRWCPGPESNRYGRNGREIYNLRSITSKYLYICVLVIA
jgi:hypothetical protein